MAALGEIAATVAAHLPASLRWTLDRRPPDPTEHLLVDLKSLGRFQFLPPSIRIEPGRDGDLPRVLKGPVLAAWLRLHGVLVLHAAGLWTPRGVIGLLGRSLAGKSTLMSVAVRHKTPFWCEDMLCLRWHGNKVESLVGPPRIWLRTANGRRLVRASTPRKRRAPLAGLLKLARAKVQGERATASRTGAWKLEPIPGLSHVGEVLAHLYGPLGEPDRDFHRLVLAASSVPMAALTVPDGIPRLSKAWPGIWSAVREWIRPA